MRAQRVELNSAQIWSGETPRQDVKAHNGLNFRCRSHGDLARSLLSPASSSSRRASSSGSPTAAPASIITWRHSAKRGDRRYVSISESIGRRPLISSVGLTPAASKDRMSSGECSSNGPNSSSPDGVIFFILPDLDFLHARRTAIAPEEIKRPADLSGKCSMPYHHR